MTTHLSELLDYIGFDDADAARLRSLHPILEPHFPTVAGRFYDAVFSNAHTGGVLTGPDQIRRLRVSLIDWMSTGLLGPWDDRFYEKRSRIGRRHVAIGLQQQYMFTAMSVVRSAYSDLIEQHCSDGVAIMRSVNKLLDIELEIMVRHYQLDSEDKLVARERRTQAERMTAMATMTAGIAHEVRNPLNAAKLQLELLDRRVRRTGIDPKVLEPCTIAQKEIQRLTDLLNDFLAFARPPELHIEEHDVAALVRQVVENELVTAKLHGANLELVVAPPQLVAHVDAPKVHQLALNLIRNALEAVQPGGHVTVELISNETNFELVVHDDGPGMPVGVRDRIYEPFFSTKEGGTGLGMSIVHSLVSLHGGSIELDTGARGTRFVVRIPRRP